MVGGSFMFALSAVAVDSEIVGKDSDAELICCIGEWTNDCCCAKSAAVAVRVSFLDLGDVEKS